MIWLCTGCCADLEGKGPLPERMLDLMTLLERESGPFCRKRLITISGHDRGLVYSANADMTLLDAIRSYLSPTALLYHVGTCPIWLRNYIHIIRSVRQG